ncbi:MAG: sensor histidine kinase [Saprospiraceae bacterium]
MANQYTSPHIRRMFKNPTPRQIAILTAFFIGGIVAICGMLALWLLPVRWGALIIIIISSVLATYYVVVWYLKNYIYRKVKVIYKNIHSHKLSPEEKKDAIDIDTHIIDNVEQEVEEWAENQEHEIERYKTWAEYRRRFVGDISHELKTPIFNIQGYIHSLLDGGLEDEKVNISFLNKAAKNVDRLQTIVEDLEAISRLESGGFIVEPTEVDIRQLTAEVFEDLEFKAAAKNISLSFKEGASYGYKVMADRESIRQVLTNLVNNSIKYGEEEGRTKVGFYDMDKYILVEVADNGIGIPVDHLPHVFDRFYRVDKSRSRAQGGSGLGLSIVKHIMEAHKQTINVRSTPQMGSTFGFTLAKAE